MYALAAIFSLLVAAAGWHYLFYSKAAGRLAGVESAGTNVARVRLRRVNGAVMLLLAMLFLFGIHALERPLSAALFAGVWVGVMVLLGVLVFLALIDLRMTIRLRRQQRLKQGVDARPPDEKS